MARREDLMEALDAIETGMCRVKESRDIWQNELVYALCQGVRLLLTEEIKHGRQYSVRKSKKQKAKVPMLTGSCPLSASTPISQS